MSMSQEQKMYVRQVLEKGLWIHYAVAIFLSALAGFDRASAFTVDMFNTTMLGIWGIQAVIAGDKSFQYFASLKWGPPAPGVTVSTVEKTTATTATKEPE